MSIASSARIAVIGGVALAASILPASGAAVIVTNLISDDQPANAALLGDPHLINAWGVSFSPTSPLWVSAADASLALVYRIDPATNMPTKVGLEVSIAGNPTGQVFNGNAAAFNGDAFIFASEDGSISGWRGALGTTAELLRSPSDDNAYKGLAIANVGGHTYLLAADFRGGEIDVVKGDAGAPDLAGKFVDPNLPAGYAPFNVQTIGDKVYVTYALQNADGDEEVAGVGLGVVSVFDTQGGFIQRVASAGLLNAPWGLALAPASFGDLAGNLLVGNFGDGRINIFNLATQMFVGQLLGMDGTPVAIDGLWALTAGNGGMAGNTQLLYFTAGPDDESHGVVGVLSPVPEPPLLLLLTTGIGGLITRWRRRA